MFIKESEYFIRQTLKLKKKYFNIHQDIDDLKKEFPKIAFQNIGSLNKPLLEVPVLKSKDSKKQVWRIRCINSDNNKGKRGGYRIFYCKMDDGQTSLFLGIFSRSDIHEGEYNVIARELVLAINDWDAI